MRIINSVTYKVPSGAKAIPEGLESPLAKVVTVPSAATVLISPVPCSVTYKVPSGAKAIPAGLESPLAKVVMVGALQT